VCHDRWQLKDDCTVLCCHSNSSYCSHPVTCRSQVIAYSYIVITDLTAVWSGTLLVHPTTHSEAVVRSGIVFLSLRNPDDCDSKCISTTCACLVVIMPSSAVQRTRELWSICWHDVVSGNWTGFQFCLAFFRFFVNNNSNINNNNKMKNSNNKCKTQQTSSPILATFASCCCWLVLCGLVWLRDVDFCRYCQKYDVVMTVPLLL